MLSFFDKEIPDQPNTVDGLISVVGTSSETSVRTGEESLFDAYGYASNSNEEIDYTDLLTELASKPVGKTYYDEKAKESLTAARDQYILSNLFDKNKITEAVLQGEAALQFEHDPVRAMIEMGMDEPGTYDTYQAYIRGQRLGRIMQQLDKEYETGLAGTVWDALTAGVSAPLNFVSGNWSYESEEFAKVYEMLGDPYITDEEAIAKARELIQVKTDKAGWLSDKNSMYYGTFSTMLKRGGNTLSARGDAATNFVFGVMDAATMGGGKALVAAARTARRTAGAASNGMLNSGGHKTVQGFLNGVIDSGAEVPAPLFNSVMPQSGKVPTLDGKAIDIDFSGAAADVRRNSTSKFGFANLLRGISERSIIDPDKVQANYDSIVARFRDSEEFKNVGAIPINSGVVSDGNQLFGWVVSGTSKSKPFKLKNGVPVNSKVVNDAINRTGGQLYKLSDDEGVVVTTFNLRRSEYADDISSAYTPGRQHDYFNTRMGSLLNFFTSSAGRLDKGLKAAALQSEALVGRLQADVGRKIKETLGGLSKEEINDLDTFLASITDGKLKNSYLRHMTRAEFTENWGSAFGGAVPNDKQWDAYLLATELDDVVWRENSLDALLRAEDLGYTVRVASPSNPEWGVPVKATTLADDIADGTKVFSTKTNDVTTIKNLKKAKGSFFRIMPERIGDDGIELVFVPEGTGLQRLLPSDVLPFKPGFSRQYIGANQYLRFGRGADAHTLGYAQTRQIAEKALQEVKNIQGKISELIPKARTLAPSTLSKKIRNLSAKEKAELDDVIAANSSWASDITDSNSLSRMIGIDRMRFMDEAGIALPGQGIDGKIAPVYARRESDMVGGLDARSKTAIRNLSGEEPETMGGFEAMFASTEKALHNKAWRSVIQEESRRWWEAAKSLIDNEADVEGLHGLSKLRKAKINAKTSAQHAAMEAAREDILRMFNMQENLSDTFFDYLGDSFATFLYGKGFSARTAEKWRQIGASLPDRLRYLAFNLKLGVFNPNQLVVQASQMAQIASIHPQLTVQSAPMLVAARLYRHAARKGGDIAAIRRHFAEQNAGLAGLSVDEMDTFLEMVQDSGRLDIMGGIAEAGGMPAMPNLRHRGGLSGMAMNNHRIFFEEGERTPRILAAAVAFRDELAKVPADARASYMKTRQFRDAWFNAQDDLTFNMTSALSAPWQRSNVAVTFQFMTYMARSAEMIFRRSGLTVPQRARLLMGNAFFYGGTGTFANSWMDENRATGGYFSNVDDSMYNAMRNGAIGALWKEMGLGEISERVAPAQGILDFIENVSTASYAEVLLGPGGGTVGSIVTDIMDTGVHLMNYQGAVTRDDLIKVATNVSSLSLAAKVYYGLAYGNYYSRAGGLPVSTDISPSEVVGMFMGATPDSVASFYRQKNVDKAMRDAVNEIGKDIGRLMENLEVAVKSGDTESAQNLSRTIAGMIAPMSPRDRSIVKKYLEPRYSSLAESNFRRAAEDGVALIQDEYVR